MDPGIIAALAMLVVWGIATFAFEAPGWIHGLLSLGVFLLIYRIVVRGTPRRTTGDQSTIEKVTKEKLAQRTRKVRASTSRESSDNS